MGAMIIFCADPLNPRRPDAHYADEARAAGPPVSLIDHDALLAGNPAGAVAGVRRDAGPAWYRGWMLPPARYAELHDALAARGVTLLTSPADYRRAHELPGWYEAFKTLTPRSVWLPAEPGVPPGQEELARAVAPLGSGPAIVKDYVKSRKHEWHEACYVPDLADTAGLAAVVARMVALQEDSLSGGTVIRSFEHFARDTGEARVWWVDGEPVLVTAHPDTPGLRPEPGLDAVKPLVEALGCRFVSTDLALREDGRPQVVEVGDGQVSDLPRGTDPTPLLDSLTGVAE